MVGAGAAPRTAGEPSIVAEPSPWDVIMGRGLRGQKYMGNIALRRVLEGRRTEYDSAGRGRKAEIMEEVYAEMRRIGCRFLSSSACSGVRNSREGITEWVEVEEKEALNFAIYDSRRRSRCSYQKALRSTYLSIVVIISVLWPRKILRMFISSYAN
jgi:hypothetical protein